MPTMYGENAEITGSLQVDGDIDLGSGDDDIQMDGSDNTFFLDGTNNKVGIGTDSPDYTLDVAGDIGVNQYIYHNGDGNTWINFTDNRIRLNAGGNNFIDCEDPGSAPHKVKINNGGNNIDFVIKDNSGDRYFMADASTSRVGIGTDSPSYKLDVRASAADTTSQITANFRSEDTDYSRITIDSTANADTQVSFMNNGSTKWSIGNEAGRDAFHITTGFGPFDSVTDPVVIAASSGNTQLTNNTYLKGGLYLGSETLTNSDNGGNVSATVPLTIMSNTSGILSATLGNSSFTGQRKIILCTGYSASYSLTVPVTSASWTGGSSGTITFTTAAGYVNLVWANSAWWVIGTFGANFS